MKTRQELESIVSSIDREAAYSDQRKIVQEFREALLEKQPTAHRSPDVLAADVLAPLHAYVAADRGAVSDITERANRIGGCALMRQQVQKYFGGTPETRTEPRLGLGLLFARVADELARDGMVKWTGKKWKIHSGEKKLASRNA